MAPVLAPSVLAPAVLALAALAVAGSARAQACLSYSDGLGNTTLTCPGGQGGYLYTPPGGVPQGLVGGRPYTGVPADIGAPLAQPGVPSVTYVSPPIGSLDPPASMVGPPPVTAPSPPPLEAAAPSDLTALQRQYLAQQAADLARKRAAAQAATAKGKLEPAH